MLREEVLRTERLYWWKQEPAKNSFPERRRVVHLFRGRGGTEVLTFIGTGL